MLKNASDIGWLIASILARAVTASLSRAHFNDRLHRSGLGAALGRAAVEIDGIGFVALIAKWFIRLITLVVAFDALGLRAVSDFESELQMAQMNHKISGVDTLFIPSASGNSFLASKLIREITRFGGDVSNMVPPPVAKRLEEKYLP